MTEIPMNPDMLTTYSNVMRCCTTSANWNKASVAESQITKLFQWAYQKGLEAGLRQQIVELVPESGVEGESGSAKSSGTVAATSDADVVEDCE